MRAGIWKLHGVSFGFLMAAACVGSGSTAQRRLSDGPDPQHSADDQRSKTTMENRDAVSQEADRLMEILNADEVPKKTLADGFGMYSEAARVEVALRTLRMVDPPPKGALLARLNMIRTPDNEALIRAAFLANLRSPRADARRYSLLGLKEVAYPALADAAVVSLRDESDQVLSIAIDILLPEAEKNKAIRALLESVHAARRNNRDFYTSISLLESHGIGVKKP